MDETTLHYTKSHEWLHVEGDVGTVGISRFAVDALTDITYVEFPSVGKQLGAGDVFGVVESVKSTSDLYAPVAGEVIEVNGELDEEPSLLNEDPFGKGWMIKLKLADPSAADALLDKAAYDEHCAAEDH